MTTSWPITCSLAMTHTVLLHNHIHTQPTHTHTQGQMVYKVSGGWRNRWLFCLTAVLCFFSPHQAGGAKPFSHFMEINVSFLWFPVYTDCCRETHTHTHTHIYKQVLWKKWNKAFLSACLSHGWVREYSPFQIHGCHSRRHIHLSSSLFSSVPSPAFYFPRQRQQSFYS